MSELSQEGEGQQSRFCVYDGSGEMGMGQENYEPVES